MRIVSSFSQEGWELYGRQFVESTLKHWPGELWVYYEGEKPDIKHDKLVLKDLFEVPGCVQYLETMNTLPIFQGVINNTRYYQLDIHKFCRKMFALVDAASDYKGQLFWLDADTQTFKDIPEAMLEGFLENTFMCYMDRPGFHSCASFVGWDNSHPVAGQWWAMLYDFYMSGKVFTQKEWHDSYILDVLREDNSIPAKNIAADLTMVHGKPTNVFDLVFKNYAEHYKGNKKYKAAAAG